MNDGPRVLLVDDQESVRVAHARVLSAHAFRVVSVDGAAKAIALLRASPFAAVLSDIGMPDMSGLEMLKELRAQKIEVPIVLITGNPELESAVEAMELGVLRYLRKPVDARTLANVTHEVIRLHGLARAERLALDNEGLQSLVAELYRARDAAQAASRAKSEFLQLMSHELRTPLGQVMAYADLVLDEELTREQRGWFAAVKRSADVTLSMIQHVLDLADLAGRKVELRVEAFDVGAVVVDVVQRLHRMANTKNLAVRCTIDPRLPRQLVGDGPKLAQVVDHVFGNALKFTDAGHVDVRAELEASPKGRAVVCISIADTGIGIPHAAQDRILDPFVQADGTLTRRHGGAGLGLAISSEIARLMGGTLVLESKPGVGTCVRFTVPLETPSHSLLSGARG